MKKLIQIASLFLILALVFTSCAKEESVSVESLEISESISKATSSFEYDIDTESGLVKFKNLDAFLDALEFLSDSPERYFTDEAFHQWEEKEGFHSLRSLYSKIQNELEQVESENDFMELQQRYQNILFDEEGPILPVSGLVLASILSEEGNVIIDNALHHFTNEYQIIITDKSPEKLSTAQSTLVSDEDKGIYVLMLNENIANERGECGVIRSDTNNTGSNNGSRKVTGVWRLVRYASPIRNQAYQVVGWQHSIDHICTMESKRRNCCWWVKNKRDNLSWGTGWGVTSSTYGSMAHGTGWTTLGSNSSSGSGTWEINYSYRCYPVVTTTGQPSSPFNFTYNGNHFKNTSLNPDLVCEDDCF